MNWIDIGFFVLTIGGFFLGFVSGLLYQIGRIVSVIGAVYSAIYLHLPVTRLLKPHVDDNIAGPASYMLLFIVTYIAMMLLLSMLDRVLREADVKKYDRTLGGIFGMLKGALIAGVLLLGLALYPNQAIREDIRSSLTGTPLLNVTRKITVMVPRTVTKTLSRTYRNVRKKSGRQLENELLSGEEKETD